MATGLSVTTFSRHACRPELAKCLDEIVMLVGHIEKIPGVLGFKGQPLGEWTIPGPDQFEGGQDSWNLPQSGSSFRLTILSRNETLTGRCLVRTQD